MLQKVLHVDTRQTAQGFYIKVHGDLFASTVPLLAETIDGIDLSSLPRILLDLGELNHIDSRGIGALVGWHRHFTNRGIKFEITQVPESVLQPLRVCHLDSVLEIGPDAWLCSDKVRLQREALWKFHDFASQILAGLGEGLIAVNLENEIVYANPGAEEILDCLEESLIGEPLLDSLKIQNLTHQEFLHCLQSEEGSQGEVRKREHREVQLLRPDGEKVWVRIILTPIFRDGIRQGTILNLLDISDEVFARQSGMRHLRRLESLRRISESIHKGLDVETMMESALEAVKEIFECDRVWLLYPCDPESPSWNIQIEVTHPDFPGAGSMSGSIPINPPIKKELAKYRDTEDPIVYDPEHPFPTDAEWRDAFKIRSQMAVSIQPHLGKAWLFGIHQCSTDRTWTRTEKSLFKEISHRIAEALNNLLLFRGNRAKAESLESLVELSGESSGEDFYRNMIRYVCRRLKVSHGFIGVLSTENEITTLATWKSGKPGVNFAYHLEGTPCETVIGRGFQHYTKEVWKQFPKDTNLESMQIHCYMGVPLMGEGGEPLGLIAILDEKEKDQPLDSRAILEVMADRVSSTIQRKRSEEALKRSEIENHAILGALPDPLVRVNRQGEVLEVRLPSLDVLAVDPFSHDLRVMIAKESLWREIVALVGEALNSQETRNFEFQVSNAHRNRDYEARISPCFGEEAIVLFRDISGRKSSEILSKVEISLLEMISTDPNLERILSRLVLASEAILPGVSGSILLYNPEKKKLFHATAPSLPEEYTRCIDGVDIGPDAGSCGTAAYRQEPVIVSDIENDPLWVNYREIALKHHLRACWSIPIFSPKQEVLGTFAIYYPSTGTPDSFQLDLIHRFAHLAALAIQKVRAAEEKAKMEEQLQQTQKLESLGILAGGIAHDFNNLLVGILGNAGMALSDLDTQSPLRPSIQEIEISAQRASDLTRQLLAYSGRGKFVVEPLRLHSLIEEMVQLLRVSVPKNIEMTLDFDSQSPLIEGDATQLRQVVMNLLINASDALEGKPGKILVRTGHRVLAKKDLVGMIPNSDMTRGDYCYLEVQDNGCGMDPMTRARIFDPFFTTKFTGRGLGLAAVLGIVRGHRGGLKVKSKLGDGTRFTLYFPSKQVTSMAPAAIITPPSETLVGAGGRILVVDDEASVRTLVERILKRQGFEVVAAPGGQEAIDMVERSPDKFDLVLLDLTMPNLDGKQTYDQLIRIQPALQIVLTSGFSEEETTDRFEGKQLAGFIQKPYRFNELSEYIRSVLSKSPDEN